jgi:hypothetical protein
MLTQLRAEVQLDRNNDQDGVADADDACPNEADGGAANGCLHRRWP